MSEQRADKYTSKQKKRKQSADDLLVKGEQIVAEAIISPVGIYWKAIGVLIFAVLVGLMLAIELGILLVVTALAMFAYATLKKEILMLVLTNKRMLFRYGILQVDVVDIRFDKIESVELERMPPGYIMGFANVVIMGTGQRYVVIPYVANGPEIRQAYNRLTLSDEDDLDEE